MNMIILVLLVVLGYTYFGGPKVPKILKDYKEMLMGVFVGILLHQFFGVRVEGVEKGAEGGPVDDGVGDIINIQNYYPSSNDPGLGNMTIGQWRNNAKENLQTRYNNYDNYPDFGEVFKAEDGGNFAEGGKKYTCGLPNHESEYQMVAVNMNDGKTAQVCLNISDPYNLDAMVPIRIQTSPSFGGHDSIGGEDGGTEGQPHGKANRWLNKTIVSCDATSSGGRQMEIEEESGPSSFYCE